MSYLKLQKKNQKSPSIGGKWRGSSSRRKKKGLIWKHCMSSFSLHRASKLHTTLLQFVVWPLCGFFFCLFINLLAIIADVDFLLMFFMWNEWLISVFWGSLEAGRGEGAAEMSKRINLRLCNLDLTISQPRFPYKDENIENSLIGLSKQVINYY